MTEVKALVNGRETALAHGTTVADVVAVLCADDRGIAVALDREVVPRSRWADVAVRDGAQVEGVAAAAGG